MAGAGRGGLAVGVGRGSGDGLALGERLEHLPAERRVLPAREVGNRILGAAEAQFHGIGIVAG
jgi:hypothetical protein